MSDTKISQDPELLVVAGNELIPVVTGGQNKYVKASTLQAGLVTNPATKASVGLSDVDNTSDAAKPISTATATALALKASEATVAGKAPLIHAHAIADVTGLQTALNDKATHAELTAAVDAVVGSAPAILDTLAEIDTRIVTNEDIAAALALSVADKADASDTTTALAGKAATVHAHAIADTTGLQAALDTKQTAAQVDTAIQAVVGAAPAALNTLVEIAAQLATDESAVSALVTTVSGKAATVHAHAIADITGLQTAIDNRPTGQQVDTFITASFDYIADTMLKPQVTFAANALTNNSVHIDATISTCNGYYMETVLWKCRYKVTGEPTWTDEADYQFVNGELFHSFHVNGLAASTGYTFEVYFGDVNSPGLNISTISGVVTTPA